LSNLFDRVASVTVAEKGSTSGILLSGLRIEFAVKKTSDKKPNKATIKIYNLSADTREQLDSIETPQVFLSAGYAQADGASIIYVGDVTNLVHEKIPPEVVTSIEADDGKNALKDTRLSITRKAGSGAKGVLTELVNAFKSAGVATKYVDSSVADVQYTTGFAAAGNAEDALDKVSDKLGLEWSIQNGELKIIKQGETDNSLSVKISPTTGLLDSPKRLSFTALKKKGGYKSVVGNVRNAKKTGWLVRSLLQPTVEPGGRVVIESDELLNEDNTFRVETVEHKGDTHGGQFTTEIEAVAT
jgi:hypothetical protein